MEKDDIYDITAVVTVRYTVLFEHPVTKAQAKKLFTEGSYEDITDEDLIEINSVVEVG